ncbi:hypothetical protein AV530_018955 [Patagioenas fasciata monilis]|uniref:Uncharacterized protein n=1 Tax=Patagioenas fasciata monilis TaxID=372326 RepID=A0A1V4J612_PATFA|nr:hypothetical protein AV530_018955 [Patagioenas fasciata monilis]
MSLRMPLGQGAFHPPVGAGTSLGLGRTLSHLGKLRRGRTEELLQCISLANKRWKIHNSFTGPVTRHRNSFLALKAKHEI